MNYGFNSQLEEEQQRGDEWIFGSTGLKCLAQIPENERAGYLPLGEIQRGREDLMDCASRGPVNILETKFNWLIKNQKFTFENDLWLKVNGYFHDNTIKFSDAFIAINSGTTREGNSMKAPLDAIRKNGLIPKKMLPLESWMTWEDYHNPERITQEMRNLGQEFLKRFVINYEKVYEPDFESLLKKDLLNVAGYAWPEPVNGEYPSTTYDPNHVFVAYKTPKYWIFDNYESDGTYDKKLASNYDLMDYGYRLLINREIVNPKKECFIIKYLKSLWQ